MFSNSDFVFVKHQIGDAVRDGKLAPRLRTYQLPLDHDDLKKRVVKFSQEVLIVQKAVMNLISRRELCAHPQAVGVRLEHTVVNTCVC